MAKKKKADKVFCPAHGVELTNFTCGQCRIEREKAERYERKRNKESARDAEQKEQAP